MHWALTDRRLLFFDAKATTGRPGKLLVALPRELVSAAPVSKALLGLGVQTASRHASPSPPERPPVTAASRRLASGRLTPPRRSLNM
ncbi:hypothetical protein [Streptomyces sp. NPDC001480]|uniref:hypothetical protein n=1 Tax=Streptomyces sp. NPDC001480 TaxID=3364577 RepID=UPI0036823302